MPKISQEDFCNIAIECSLDPQEILKKLKKLYPNMEHRPSKVLDRLTSYRKRGLLPLESGNSVSLGEMLKGTTTVYGPTGKVERQYVKTDVEKETFLASFNTAIEELSERVTPLPNVPAPTGPLTDNLMTLYITNDVHFGAYMWGEETEGDWDVDIALNTVKRSYDYQIQNSPPAKIGVIADLGDLTETDDFKNMTPKSGNILDVDGRYPKILRAAYESLIYGIQRALEKHELVYFYNIAGNHDISTGIAVREVIRMAFKDNPRVIIDESPTNIKYHQHGSVLLQFFHGDGMKLHQAGEVMAHDMCHIFSETKYRYAHAGHTHKDAVVDTRLCRAESHRNLAPLNAWAFNHGYRSGLGTTKSITYDTTLGEVSRQTFNLS